MNVKHFLTPLYVLRAARAVRRAREMGLVGLRYDLFGRCLGRRLLLRRMRGSIRLMLQPVDFLRYFEFDYVGSHADICVGSALDVSSPSLFSLYQADHHPKLDLQMINPDGRDLQMTRMIADRVGLNLETRHAGIDSLEEKHARFQTIWSISVLEHVSGALDDQDAIRILVGALAPGGCLIVTVMVDRLFRDEYLNRDQYDLGGTREADGYFFQRFYDESALWSRLFDQVPNARLTDLEWFGEKEPGIYHRYVERARMGFDYGWAVDEPIIAARDYSRFPSFGEMPGVGVCGFRLVKESWSTSASRRPVHN